MLACATLYAAPSQADRIMVCSSGGNSSIFALTASI